MAEKYPGISTQVCQQLMPARNPMYQSPVKNLEIGKAAIRKAQSVGKACVFIHGEAGSGKTSFAAKLAHESNFALVQTCFPEDLVGLTDADKCMHIRKIFERAYVSASSCVILDDLERLLEYCPVGPQFSNSVLQALLVFLKKRPPPGKSLLIIAISSSGPRSAERYDLKKFGVLNFFDSHIYEGSLMNDL
ncbi:hypothetical protein MTP99_004288 [Tenebrio molitor]|jgi:vesicle-fusing ATPase|nr:hypothetical protein MTP99_004288 [Tenebrio molitor]